MPPTPQLVALRLGSRQETADAIAEVWAAGDAALPLDEHVSDIEAARLLAEMKPGALVTAEGRRELAGGVPAQDGAALVLPTSGTTGRPKGVELGHAALSAAARLGLERLDAGPDRPWLCCLPVGRIGGIMTLVRGRVPGSGALIQERFDPHEVARAEAGYVSLVPAMLLRLLEEGVDLSRFEAILLGGAAAPPALLERARSAGARVVTTYGMTETCGGVVYDGIPLGGVGVDVSEEGLIRISGPTLMNGYRLRPEATQAVLEPGRLTTSDLGRVAPDGRLQVLGRVDDVIVTGGLKVHPGEIEEALLAHPDVKEALVVGTEDPRWGQKVVAHVVPAHEVSPDELVAFLEQRLPAFKVPKEIRFEESLKSFRSGKPARAGRGSEVQTGTGD